jgi:hypothetical protein
MIEKDKQLHLLAGFATGIFPAIMYQGGGLLVAVGAGLLKEYYDSTGKGIAEPKDVFFTIAGGLLAEAWVHFAADLLRGFY